MPALAVAEAPAGELPAIEEIASAVVAEPVLEPAPAFQAAFVDPAAGPAAAPAPTAFDTSRFVQPQVAQAAPSATGSHLVQLGSFASEQGARRAWNIYAQRYPELAGHQMVISEAVVKGKHYWRVSAGGFDRTGSTSMCGRVRNGGQGCFAYAEDRPLPGAVLGRDTRLAQR